MSLAGRAARSTWRAARRLARARLVQFLAIGGAMFAVAPRPRDPLRVEISRAELAIVEAAEGARGSRRGGPALDAGKAAELRARLIDDKLLFQEGVRLGLDQDDPIIRQRVVQKVLLLAEELGGATREPTRAELRAAYDRAPDRYRAPARYHLMHVFAARRDALPASAALAGEQLPDAGEPFPLPREARATQDELARAYGPTFAAAVVAQSPGGFGAPIASSYGWHRVRVIAVDPGQLDPFDQVAPRVAFDLTLERRERVLRAFLDRTAARYEVVVDGEPLAGYRPALRLARYEDPSGED